VNPEGIDIRRGFSEASCSFLDDSVRFISSFDRRGIRDVFGDRGEEGGDGSWIVLDKREDCCVVVAFLTSKVFVVGVRPVWGSSSRFRTTKLGDSEVE
jgi:hypothetical protein